jgi:hypothetical protein
MNRDEIISMANTAGFTASVSIEDCGDVPFVKLPQPIPKSTELFSMLRQFAALVAATEREACAKVCEAQRSMRVARHPARVEFDPDSMMAQKCAAAIRAMGQA